MKSIGEIIPDGLTDGKRLSVYQSSVNPISVANSVANIKKTATDGTPTVLQTDTRAPKKSFPREHYRRNKSVRNFIGKYRRHYRRNSVIMAWLVIVLQTLCEIPMDIIRR